MNILNSDIVPIWITVNKKSQIKKKDNSNEDSYMKKILCNNILTTGICNYGDKCMYAHNLDEQNIEPIRKQAYDIITGKEKISYKPNKELSKTLLQLTKVCNDCINKSCPGGYNCKYGVIDKKFQVCADDLRYGICYNTICNCVHLTNKGLIPLNSPNINQKIRIINYTNNDKIINNIPNGTLLSDNFFIKSNDPNPNPESDSDNETSEIIEHIKEYLDHDSDSEKSIFD